MDWNDNNLLPIVYSYGEKKDYTDDEKKTMKIFCRNYTPAVCAFCGGTYKKLQKCISIGAVIIKNLRHCCSLCNSLIAYTSSQNKCLKIAVSNLSQLEIIRKTINYILKNKTTPDIESVDPEADESDVICNKFFNNATNIKYKHLRVFMTSKIDVSKILLNLPKSNNVDEDDLDDKLNHIQLKNKFDREIKLIEMIQKITEQTFRENDIKKLQHQILFDL